MLNTVRYSEFDANRTNTRNLPNRSASIVSSALAEEAVIPLGFRPSGVDIEPILSDVSAYMCSYVSDVSQRDRR